MENTAALEPAIERALAALAAGRSVLLDVFLTGVAEGKWQGQGVSGLFVVGRGAATEGRVP